MFGLPKIVNPIANLEGLALTLGAVFVCGWLVFDAGSDHGVRRVEAKNEKVIERAEAQTEKAQGSVEKQVRTVEARSKVRRAHSEKKASDAVAQIQAREPATDPVLIWAAAIDGLRHDRQAGAGEPEAAHSRAFGGNPNPVLESSAPTASSWAI